MRSISKTFIDELLKGSWSNLLERVKADDTLCLCIREDCINIYYRGGSLFRLCEKKGKYKIKFDSKYYVHKDTQTLYGETIKSFNSIEEYITNIPLLKAEMDLWFYEHPKSEREYQQIIYRDNNNGSIASDTDYFIADIEYANTDNNSRFDLVGIKWPSTAVSRKNPASPTLAIMEFKYGDGALSGKSGITKHFEDIQNFFDKKGNYSNLCREMEGILRQKMELGLLPVIPNGKDIKIDDDINCEFILLLANHKPTSTILKRELEAAETLGNYKDLIKHVDINVATAGSLGYGLYDKHMLCVHDYIKTL